MPELNSQKIQIWTEPFAKKVLADEKLINVFMNVGFLFCIKNKNDMESLLKPLFRLANVKTKVVLLEINQVKNKEFFYFIKIF